MPWPVFLGELRAESRAERTHLGRRRGPFKTAGGRFAAGPWLGHHLGEGEGMRRRQRLMNWLGAVRTQRLPAPVI